MRDNVFVVIMRRYGNREAHSYCIGVFGDYAKAEKAGLDGYEYRGHKYEPEILDKKGGTAGNRPVL